MINRTIKPLKSNSFFLFGARGTGKSTFLQTFLRDDQPLFLDLLDEEVYDRLSRDPKLIEALSESRKHPWIVIDEVQRLPQLLNGVHRMIEKCGQKFALTGSSARKLKRGSANLLAGRAFVNSVFPLTHEELGSAFDLEEVLHWGSLPKLLHLPSPAEKRAYLRSYCLTYIREEIQLEQVVRKLEPFREFLVVAAQMSGKVLNYSNVGRDVGVQAPTIQTYYQILEDTHLGFFLPAFHRSVRKSQTEAPKFYLFDNGVKKALESSLDSRAVPGTSAYGEIFEAFLIQEIFRLNHYYEKDFRLSHFRTKNGVEIDLILTKGHQTVLVEIKSTDHINPVEVASLGRLRDTFGSATQAFYLSRDPQERTLAGIKCEPWDRFLKNFRYL